MCALVRSGDDGPRVGRRADAGRGRPCGVDDVTAARSRPGRVDDTTGGRRAVIGDDALAGGGVAVQRSTLVSEDVAVAAYRGAAARVAGQPRTAE